jgi:hypothetical protein
VEYLSTRIGFGFPCKHRAWHKRLATTKHSSLLGLSVSDEDKSFETLTEVDNAKLISWSLTRDQIKLECFVMASLLEPSLLFKSKTTTYPSVAIMSSLQG